MEIIGGWEWPLPKPSVLGMTDAWLLFLGGVSFTKEEVWCLCGQVALSGQKSAVCSCTGVELLAITFSSHISSLLQYLIPSSSKVLAGPGGRRGSLIAPGDSESFFRSYKSSLRLLKCVVLKAVREPILNGGDTEMSGASFTALGSNLCFCWNYLSRSLPSCCKSLPGFDEKHICAEIHWLSCFFPTSSATLFCFVHLVQRRAASPARSARLLSCCVWGLHAQPVLFALVCVQCLQRPLAGVSGTSEREGGWLCFSPGTTRAVCWYAEPPSKNDTGPQKKRGIKGWHSQKWRLLPLLNPSVCWHVKPKWNTCLNFPLCLPPNLPLLFSWRTFSAVTAAYFFWHVQRFLMQAGLMEWFISLASDLYSFSMRHLKFNHVPHLTCFFSSFST